MVSIIKSVLLLAVLLLQQYFKKKDKDERSKYLDSIQRFKETVVGGGTIDDVNKQYISLRDDIKNGGNP